MVAKYSKASIFHIFLGGPVGELGLLVIVEVGVAILVISAYIRFIPAGVIMFWVVVHCLSIIGLRNQMESYIFSH